MSQDSNLVIVYIAYSLEMTQNFFLYLHLVELVTYSTSIIINFVIIHID